MCSRLNVYSCIPRTTIIIILKKVLNVKCFKRLITNIFQKILLSFLSVLSSLRLRLRQQISLAVFIQTQLQTHSRGKKILRQIKLLLINAPG